MTHPITPPPELVQQWQKRFEQGADIFQLFTNIFQAGADQELEACCEWLDTRIGGIYPGELRAARRPRPLSLKELALESVKRFEKSGEFFSDQMRELEFIRKALETIND